MHQDSGKCGNHSVQKERERGLKLASSPSPSQARKWAVKNDGPARAISPLPAPTTRPRQPILPFHAPAAAEATPPPVVFAWKPREKNHLPHAAAHAVLPAHGVSPNPLLPFFPSTRRCDADAPTQPPPGACQRHLTASMASSRYITAHPTSGTLSPFRSRTRPPSTSREPRSRASGEES
jgi:hypothetical protein